MATFDAPTGWVIDGTKTFHAEFGDVGNEIPVGAASWSLINGWTPDGVVRESANVAAATDALNSLRYASFAYANDSYTQNTNIGISASFRTIKNTGNYPYPVASPVGSAWCWLAISDATGSLRYALFFDQECTFTVIDGTAHEVITTQLRSFVYDLQILDPFGYTGEIICSSADSEFVTAAYWHRLGIRKIGTTLTFWADLNSGTGTTADDTGMTLQQTVTVAAFEGTYSAYFSLGERTKYRDYPEYPEGDGAGLPQIKISDMVCFEFITSSSGGVSIPHAGVTFTPGLSPPGLPNGPINLPPGCGTPAYPPWAGPGLSMRKLAETAGYHRYKALRTAMAIYNNLRLDQ